MAPRNHDGALRRRLLAAISSGLCLGGCEDQGQGVGRGESRPVVPGPTTTSTGGVDPSAADSGRDLRFDLGVDPSAVPCNPLGVVTDRFVRPWRTDDGALCDGSMPSGVEATDVTIQCLPRPPEGCAIPCLETLFDVGCGAVCPLTQNEAYCCFVVQWSRCHVAPGRPFTVRGRARVAPLIAREDYARDVIVDLSDLDEDACRRIGDLWAHEALFEHASIASFGRFILELLSVGAPASLVDRAQACQREEYAHALTMFGLARAYSGVSRGPGVLDVRGALDESTDPAIAAVKLASEGCIAETVSAEQLYAAAYAATEPTVRELLLEMAREERAHAALAWEALAWWLSRADAAVRAQVASTFDDLTAHVGRHTEAPNLPDAVMVRHGLMTERQRAQIAERTLHQVIRPCASRLLEGLALAHPSTRKQPMRAPVL